MNRYIWYAALLVGIFSVSYLIGDLIVRFKSPRQPPGTIVCVALGKKVIELPYNTADLVGDMWYISNGVRTLRLRQSSVTDCVLWPYQEKAESKEIPGIVPPPMPGTKQKDLPVQKT